MESGDEVISKIKLVEEKDLWMKRGIRTVDVNDDCSKLKEIFDEGHKGVLVSEISEFGDDELVGWITKDKFESFKENHEDCKAGDMINPDASFPRLAPATTILAAKLKLKKEGVSALPIIAVHFGKDIGMGYLTTEDIENITKKYSK